MRDLLLLTTYYLPLTTYYGTRSKARPHARPPPPHRYTPQPRATAACPGIGLGLGLGLGVTLRYEAPRGDNQVTSLRGDLDDEQRRNGHVRAQ